MARPTKKTPELVAELIRMLEEGNYRVVAAKCVDITYETLLQWMKEDESFSLAVHRAEAKAERTLVGYAIAGAEKDARYAFEFLSRKFPKRWSKSREDKPAGTGKPKLPSEMSDAELLEEAAKRIRPKPSRVGDPGPDVIAEEPS